jgi:enoyl-CoA hydratase/carnithine racemase
VHRAEGSNPEQPESEVLVQDAGRVRTVTLNRPERVNAFTATSYRRLARVLNEADGAGEVSVVLMEGAGGGFSSGVDLASASVEGEALGENFDHLIESLIRFSKPLLAAVHGAAVGFGTTLLLHCDLVLVADTARLRFPFTALGTTPEAASSVLLPQIVGLQRAADLLLTSRWITGSEAAQMGLAARCCPEASLHSEALATAQALTELPDAALATAKRLVRAGAAAVTRDALGRERAEAGALHDALGPMGYRGTSRAGLLARPQQEVPPT